MKAVAAATQRIGQLEDGDLTKGRNLKHVWIFRQIAHWLCVRRVGRSTLQVGKFFERDHSTIVHSVRAVDNLLLDEGSNGPTAKKIEAIWATACGLEVEVQEQLKKPVVATKSKTKRNVKVYHWSRYEAGSRLWFYANDNAFREGLKKSASVYLEAGE
jgi:hypothetical protein